MQFTGRLAELNLIEPVQIDIEFVDGSDTKLQGLYWIAAAALKALPAAQLAELRDRELSRMDVLSDGLGVAGVGLGRAQEPILLSGPRRVQEGSQVPFREPHR